MFKWLARCTSCCHATAGHRLLCAHAACGPRGSGAGGGGGAGGALRAFPGVLPQSSLLGCMARLVAAGAHCTWEDLALRHANVSSFQPPNKHAFLCLAQLDDDWKTCHPLASAMYLGSPATFRPSFLAQLDDDWKTYHLFVEAMRRRAAKVRAAACRWRALRARPADQHCSAMHC